MRINRHPFLRFIAAPGEDGGGEPAGTPGAASAPEPHDGFDFPDDTPIESMTETQKTEYWRHKARKHEQSEKRLAQRATDYDDMKRQLDDAHAAALTEQERAVEAARLDGEVAGAQRYRDSAVRYAVRAAATAAGMPQSTGGEDPLDAILSSLDTSKLLTDDGEVDESKIAKIVAPFAAVAAGSRQGEDPFLRVARRAANSGGAKSPEEMERQYADKYKIMKEK